MSRSTGLTRSVLADQVKERLLSGILDGTYPADSRIVETSVARDFGVSQAPVREALRGLEALGVIEIQPFRGATVRSLDADDLLDAYVVRTAIECLAAKLATPKITDADLKRLEDLCHEMQVAAGEDDGAAVAKADVTFHGAIIDLSGNGTLGRVWRSLEPLSRTFLTLVIPGADPQWTADLHLPIMTALRTRDPEAVATALEKHFEDAAQLLRDGFGEVPKSPGSAASQE